MRYTLPSLSSLSLLKSSLFLFPLLSLSTQILSPSSPFIYSGTLGATLLQNSHLAPLPPSQEFASTNRKSFTTPGSSLIKYCRFSVTLTCVIVPPVEFRFICIGAPCAEEYVGQSIFPRWPWGTVAFLAFALASAIDITGVLLMMKFPIIFENAWMKPFVGVVALREK